MGTLREVARGGGYASRAEITHALAVGAATVSRALKELLVLGLVEPGRVRATAGRPMIGVALSDKIYGSIGIRVSDLHDGVIELAGAVTALNGRTLAYETRSVSTPRAAGRRQSVLVSQIARLASDLSEQCRRVNGLVVLGVGVQVGGHVYNGTVIRSVNVEEFSKLELEQRLTNMLDMQCVVENDLTALAVLMALFNPLQSGGDHRTEDPEVRPLHLDSLAVVGVFDDGIGAGMVVGGRPYRGAHGLATEVGHVPVVSGSAAQRCRCGQFGCLESVATPARLRDALVELGVSGQIGTQELIVDSRLVPDHLRSDIFAAFQSAGRALGLALAMLTNFVDPGKILMLMDPQLRWDKGDLTAAYHDAMAKERQNRLFSPFANPNLDAHPLDHDELARLHAQAAAAIVLDRLMSVIENAGRE
jgi:predicted NBD/HSP70 family sugar kinase